MMPNNTGGNPPSLSSSFSQQTGQPPQLTLMPSPNSQLYNYNDNDSMTISSEQPSTLTLPVGYQNNNNPPSSAHQIRHQRLSGRSSTGSLTIDGQQYLSNLQQGSTGLGGGMQSLQQQQQQLQQQHWDNESTYSDSKSSSPHPSFYDGVTSARSSGFSNPRNSQNNLSLQLDRVSSRDERDSSSNMMTMGGGGGLGGGEGRGSGSGTGFMLGGQQLLSLLQNRIVSIPVPTLRFDRLGSLLWTGTNTFLYDFDELQRTTHHTTFYLIDELKLKSFFVNLLNNNRIPEEEFDFNGVFRSVIPEQAVSMGLTSMDRVRRPCVLLSFFPLFILFIFQKKLLQKSGAIITTWNQVDFPQLKLFMNGWKAQSNSKFLTAAAGLIPEAPNEPVLSPTQSMSESFNIGSSPSDLTKGRMSKRRTSGAIELKKDSMRNIQDIANMRLGIGIPAVSNNTSRGQSMISVKSELSPVNNNERTSSLDFANLTTPSLSLIDYWYLLRNSNLGMDNVNHPRTNFGKGIIAFERSNEIGLIIRANAKFNIPEDIWCLFYMEDATNYFLEQQRRNLESAVPPVVVSSSSSSSSSNSSLLQSSFGAFLMQLLPQTRILFQYLQHEQAYQQVNMRQQQQQSHHLPFQFNSMQSGNHFGFSFLFSSLFHSINVFILFYRLGIAISYYSHRTEGMNSSNPLQVISETGPPAALNNSQYRTIGTLDQNFQQILSR
jgi:hypothetical protein